MEGAGDAREQFEEAVIGEGDAGFESVGHAHAVAVLEDVVGEEAVDVDVDQIVLKPWILPTGNDFIKDPSKRHVRPEGNPGDDFPFVQNDFLQ